jgi:hypothetical protein
MPWARINKDEEPETFAISSTTEQKEIISPFVPPYSSGNIRERNPCLPKASTISQGNSPVASISAALGKTILSAVFEAAALIMSLSLSIPFIRIPLEKSWMGIFIQK